MSYTIEFFVMMAQLHIKSDIYLITYNDCLVEDCSNSSAPAVEILQACTKPSIYLSYLIWGWTHVSHIILACNFIVRSWNASIKFRMKKYIYLDLFSFMCIHFYALFHLTSGMWSKHHWCTYLSPLNMFPFRLQQFDDQMIPRNIPYILYRNFTLNWYNLLRFLICCDLLVTITVWSANWL